MLSSNEVRWLSLSLAGLRVEDEADATLPTV